MQKEYDVRLLPKAMNDIWEYGNPEYRKIIFGEYVMPFVIDEAKKTVWVTRVFHGKSNYQKYL